MEKILKYLEAIERDVAALKKYIAEQEKPKEEKIDPAAEEFKNTAIRIMEVLNKEYNSKFKTNLNTNIAPIMARLKQGYTFEDCVLVIKDRKDKWGEDPKMCEYLQPSTLFRPTNFENYLNSAKRTNTKKYSSYENHEVEDEIFRRMAV